MKEEDAIARGELQHRIHLIITGEARKEEEGGGEERGPRWKGKSAQQRPSCKEKR